MMMVVSVSLMAQDYHRPSKHTQRVVSGRRGESEAQRTAYFKKTNKDGSIMRIKVKEPGQLINRITEDDRLHVTMLEIEGPLNDQDLKVLCDLGRRKELPTHELDKNGKPKMRKAWLDLDLERARLRTKRDLANVFQDCSFLRTIILPNNMTELGNYAFSSCSMLENVLLPYGLEYIGKSAFSYCRELKEIEIPETVSEIGNNAFANCSKLEEIWLPEGLEEIGKDAFRYSALKYIDLPESLRVLGSGAFNSTNINHIFIPASLEQCDFASFDTQYMLGYEVEPGNPILSSIDGVLYTADRSTLLRYPTKREGSYVLPRETNNIDQNAFRNCSEIQEIILHPGINEIYDNMFAYCRKLTHIELPNHIRSIGRRAFDHCTSLLEIKLPHALETIGEHAFQDCKVLREIELPRSIKVIGNKAFDDCDRLLSVTCLAPVPPVMEKMNGNTKKLIIRVEESSFKLYKSDKQWKKFKLYETF